MSERRLRISLFAHNLAKDPQHVEWTFAELGRYLEERRVGYPSKDSVPLWSPAEYEDGATRGNKGVRRIHVGVVDLDDVPTVDVERVVGAALEGSSAIVHSTWSHHESLASGRVRARVILELSRPVSPGAEWRDFWRRLVAWVGIPPRRRGGVDKSAKDEARFYYLPSAPQAALGAALFARLPGEPLDVDRLLERDWQALAAPRATLETLGEIARRLDRGRAPSKELAGRVRALAAGERYARPGERDDATWALVARLARTCRGASEREIELVFERSLAAMNREDASDPYPPESVREKVVRARALDEGQEDEGDALRARWRECLTRSGRGEVYSESDLDQIASGLGVARDRLGQCWVLQHGSDYWILGERDGEAAYDGPYLASATPERAEVALAAADSAGVVCQVRGSKRLSRKAPSDLVADHGTVVDEVVRDLSAARPSLDLDRRVLVVPACPLRPELEPRRSPEIERWLEILGGDCLDVLLDWLACATRLEQPCAALYFEGASGAGKGVLSSGLSRLWTRAGPTELKDALASDYNDALLRCPLVFGDETIPRDRGGRPLTEELRKLIAEHSRTLRVKYHNTSPLLGSVRVILAANNRGMLASLGDLTAHDVTAICNRLIYVPVSTAATEHLQQIGGFGGVRDWVYGDQIAEHALWLRETRQVRSGGRFLVDGRPGPLVRSMVTSSGLRASVCHWLVQWLLDSSDIGQVAPVQALGVREGKIEISARALLDSWEQYRTSDLRRPSISRLATALHGLSLGSVHRRVGGQTIQHEVVDPTALAEWAAEHGFASTEDLEEAVRRKSERARVA